MTTDTMPFDAADYLADPESQIELIADAFQSGNAAYITSALGTVARARGMGQIAKDAGVTREALYKALTSEGDPKLTTLLGVLKALDLTLNAEKRIPA